MARRKKPLPLLENLEILDAGSEGKAVARYNEKVVFVPFVVPGDIVDVQVFKSRSSFMEGRAVKFHKLSDKRVEPSCAHFGVCGGCKWQNMDYAFQLRYKQKQVEDNLSRIGKIDVSEIFPIIPSENKYYYRNKLEYTFSNHRWLTQKPTGEETMKQNMNALGFHIPARFDKVLNIDHCYLQEEPSNEIRLAVKQYADEHKLSFYDVKKWEGFLRNLLIRNTSTGELLLILVFHYDDPPVIKELLEFLKNKFPQITSLYYVINPKKNDTINDLNLQLYSGKAYITEKMEDLEFMIGPVSFFQTNSLQALTLYKLVREYADLKGDEVVYDLYTGTGTIANFVAGDAKKVVGIEYVESSVVDAKTNSERNKVENTSFYAGDMMKIFTSEFIETNGKPDVLITDPPRAGMHEKEVRQNLEIGPEKIVSVSCNPATQARDVNILLEKYVVKKIQPVDMFPHTQHVENVLLLSKIQ